MKNFVVLLASVLIFAGLVSAQTTSTTLCVGEGGYTAVAPGAIPCCAGLTAVGCDEPVNGSCPGGCVGATYCTLCGNGQCGPGENICNCPEDCTIPCEECDYPVCDGACPPGQVCVGIPAAVAPGYCACQSESTTTTTIPSVPEFGSLTILLAALLLAPGLVYLLVRSRR